MVVADLAVVRVDGIRSVCSLTPFSNTESLLMRLFYRL
jgi:hypothetical protein